MKISAAFRGFIISVGFALIAPSAAYAAVINVNSDVVTGTIFDPVGGVSDVTTDFLIFAVGAPGTVTIDVLSHDVLAGDSSVDGLSALDTEMFLFEFDDTGDLGLLGALLADNDDADFPTDGAADGSVSRRDSFLSVDLGVGFFVLALTDFAISENEIRNGRLSASINDDSTFADYQVTFTGISQIPAPAALPLFLVGLAGLCLAKRRRT